MTRQEFVENVTSFGELIDFCQEEQIDTCDDIYDAEYINDIILENIREMCDWEQIRDFISGIPAGCDYYREDGYGGYEDAGYYFEDYKHDVLRYMDDTASWDEEDEDDNPEDEDADEQVCYYTSECEESEDDIETHSFMDVLGRAS